MARFIEAHTDPAVLEAVRRQVALAAAGVTAWMQAMRAESQRAHERQLALLTAAQARGMAGEGRE